MRKALRSIVPRAAGGMVLGAGAGVLAAAYAFDGDNHWGWVLLGGLGTALSVALIPLTQRVLTVHHVTAYGLIGLKLPTAPPAWIPGTLGGASLLGSAVILAADWPISLWILWLAAIGAVMAAVTGYSFWLARQRGRRWPTVETALAAHEPQFLVYTGRPDGGAYQIEQWVGPLRRIGVPFAIIVRHNAAATALQSRPALDGIPILACLNAQQLDRVVTPSVRAVFYVNSVAANINMVSYRHLTHIYLGHGDSDKEISAHPAHSMYDKIFVAGQEAIDRYAANNVLIPEDKFAIVGRPQLDGVQSGKRERGQDEPLTVLYAPTWLGYNKASTLSSLPAATPFIEYLLAQGVRIIFRPHPFSNKTATERQLVAGIDALLARDGGGNILSRAAAAASLVDVFNDSDALITDVSSVLVDYTATGRPIGAIVDRNEALIARYPSLRAAQLLCSAGELGAFLRLAEDNISPYAHLAEGYQGSELGFAEAVHTVLHEAPSTTSG